MIIEMRTYDIDPGIPMPEFLEAYERLGLPTQKRILEGFLGYFVTEIGTQNQVRHFWAFTDLNERQRRRAELAADAQWQECIKVVRPMIARWDNTIMSPTSFSPIRELPVAPGALGDEGPNAFTFGQGVAS
ncbi:NIPSNAP family protein [Leucobacter chinensis]|uniref:NIPSNAP family protein n=1 Tax=Leucobacter chinensis TaxID=2851010 RepID=UPI001C250867|nr:NIPSNAP family protein [Leucobacter chinensis]